MPGKWVTSNPAISKLVEKQMRNWELARAQSLDAPKPREREVEEFVTISRAVGSGGAELAAMLGERLDWPVFDKQILQTMAGEDEIRRQLYESMDERDLGWFEEAIRSFGQDEFTKNDYFRTLTETVLSLARQARSVFLGRGIDMILPKQRGLRVRIIAQQEQRIQRFAQLNQVSLDQAAKQLERREKERAEFVRRYFHRDMADQSRFDLVLNLERFSFPQAADMILAALQQRGIVAK